MVKESAPESGRRHQQLLPLLQRQEARVLLRFVGVDLHRLGGSEGGKRQKAIARAF